MRRLAQYLVPFCILLAQKPVKAQQASGNTAGGVIYSTADGGHTPVTDSTVLFNIKEIHIEGAKQTRPKIIHRELGFAQGQQYALNVLVDRFRQAKVNLMNTGLFLDVVVALKSLQGYDASILISVKERWYIFPMPFARVVDRGLQDWARNQNMDMNRIKYGIKVTHRNFTGRNDRATLDFTHGYTRQVGLRYTGLQLDRRLHWTANLSVEFGKNRDVMYATEEGRRLNFKDPARFVHSYFRTGIEAVYRPGIFTRHTFGLGYNNENISDSVFRMNPAFAFQKGRVHFVDLYYRMQYFGVDFIPYPTKGKAVDLLVNKRGLMPDFNLWQATLRTWVTWPLGRKWYLNNNNVAHVKLPFKQPFITQGFLGVGNTYMQGYENFFIDGVAGGYTKWSISKNIINTTFHINSNRIKKLSIIPFKVYAKTFANVGYVYNQENFKPNLFNNRPLYSGGVGLDVILFYDMMLKLEWSWNHLGQNGLYLHNKNYL